VANNVIDITDKELYKRTNSIYINAVNITVSGADVVSATEDGTTVNVMLDGATDLNAEVSVTFGTSGKNCSVSGNTGKVALEMGEGTLNLSVMGYYYTSSLSGTVKYTINFKVDAELTETPTRLMDSDSKDGYAGVAMEIGLKDYFKQASTYYLVEGENLTELEGKSYTFTTAVGGTHTLTFAAGNKSIVPRTHRRHCGLTGGRISDKQGFNKGFNSIAYLFGTQIIRKLTEIQRHITVIGCRIELQRSHMC
jgi:hypothetical protein